MDSAPLMRKTGVLAAPGWEPEHRDSYPPLTADLEVDTAIVGGGVVGLACALELSDRGVAVALVERDRIASGSTGWCAGVLSHSTTLDVSLVEKAFGQETARAISRAVASTLNAYSQRFPHTQWQTGNTLYLAAKPSHVEILRQEETARAAFGLNRAAVADDHLATLLPGFFGALKEEDEHGVNPVLLMQAMARQAAAGGAKIFEQTAVIDWQCADGKVSLRTTGGVIRARRLILAVGLSGASQKERQHLDRYLVPVIGHVLITEPSQAIAEMSAKHGVIASWDSLHLYHYARYLADGRMLVGGEELPGAIPGVCVPADDAHVRRLHQWAQQHHNFVVPKVQHAWRASLIFPGDGMPLVQQRQIGGCPVVTVVTDGLPFAFALGAGVARKFCEGEDWLTDALSDKRRMTWQARLLSWLPPVRALRTLAHRLAFAAFKVIDHV